MSLRHGWKYAPAFPKRTPQKFYQLHVQIIVLAVGGLIKDDENYREYEKKMTGLRNAFLSDK